MCSNNTSVTTTRCKTSLPITCLKYLKTLDTDKITVAVLCDWEISVRQLSDQLRTREERWAVSTYDGGVEWFYFSGAPVYREESSEDGGRAELTEWLRAESGILVTHAHQYRGCEVDAVILVSRLCNMVFNLL